MSAPVGRQVTQFRTTSIYRSSGVPGKVDNPLPPPFKLQCRTPTPSGGASVINSWLVLCTTKTICAAPAAAAAALNSAGTTSVLPQLAARVARRHDLEEIVVACSRKHACKVGKEQKNNLDMSAGDDPLTLQTIQNVGLSRYLPQLIDLAGRATQMS